MILNIFAEVVFWIWLVVLVASIVLEALTPSDLVSIWFAAGSFVALIIAIFWPKLIWVQIVAFVVISFVLVISTRKLAKKLQNTPDVKTNIDSIVGQIGKVSMTILPHEIGEVKVEGKLWSAISDVEIQKDEFVEVLAVDGVKLIVNKYEENENNK